MAKPGEVVPVEDLAAIRNTVMVSEPPLSDADLALSILRARCQAYDQNAAIGAVVKYFEAAGYVETSKEVLALMEELRQP